ncbi:grasp-with-spasm system ATP-grasp peptide maturase [Flavobacterium sp.]|uniref:grasp-with-spasm system ATP-grasp peptide maturase n=1 Tax=Flavobacterium sp. TaxID=239 RepID=UPI003752296A
MVLIITSEDDLSSNDVIDWLIYYKVPFLRISHNDKIYYKSLSINNLKFEVVLKINEITYNLTDFKAFWYRRSFINMLTKEYNIKNKLDSEIKKHLINEAQEFNSVVKRYIELHSINKHNDIFLNKLEILRIASNTGFQIPNSIITDNKSDLLIFKKTFEKIITKNFSQGIFINNKDTILGNSTKIVDNSIINLIPDHFHYSFFQECIEKSFELRIFFLKSKFYTCAIFSQNNEKTKIDFRNYDTDNLNRTPPFELPQIIKKKLIKLISIIKINSGSIDMIVSKKNEYIFLEINPIGQFSQLSIPCNYYIERKIAFELIKKNNGTIK